jgi:long-chain fatty acid transport protein
MGGAFVALADDFSAVYWNPAGLALFDRKTVGLSLADSIQRATYRQQIYVPGRGNVDFLDARSVEGSRLSGLGAGVYPFGDRWSVGIGIYSSAGFGITWDDADMMPVSASHPGIRWSSSLSVTTIAPAIACEVAKGLYVGSSLCLNFGRFAFARYAGNFLAPLPEPPYMEPIDLGQYEESLTGRGISAQLGILYRPTTWLSLGVSLRTASTIAFKGHAQVAGFPALSAAVDRQIAGQSGVEKKITWPERLDAGLAVRPMDRLVLTAGLQWSRWSRLKSIRTDYLDPTWATFMGERGNDEMPMFDRDTWVVRCGAEYSLGKFALRAGFHADPAPISDGWVNLLFPQEDSLGFCLGAGFHWAGLRIDIGLDYLSPKRRPDGPSAVSVIPPSSGTIWEFWLPGRFTAKTLTLGCSISRGF